MLKTEDFESAAVAKPTALAYFGTDRRRRGYVGPVVEASQRQRAEGYKAPLQYRWRGGGGKCRGSGRGKCVESHCIPPSRGIALNGTRRFKSLTA